MVESVGYFGKGEVHTQITIIYNNKKLRGIAFYTVPDNFSYTPKVGKEVILVGNLEESRFAGKVERRLRLEDIIKNVI
jgi:hypothetical protein